MSHISDKSTLLDSRAITLTGKILSENSRSGHTQTFQLYKIKLNVVKFYYG